MGVLSSFESGFNRPFGEIGQQVNIVDWFWPTGPINNIKGQVQNKTYQTTLPPLSAYLNAVRAGFESWENAEPFLQRYGIPLYTRRQKEQNVRLPRAWSAVWEAGFTWLRPPDMYAQFLRGRAPFDRVMSAIEKMGVHPNEKGAWYDSLRRLPTPEQLTAALQAGHIDQELYELLLRWQGWHPNDWAGVKAAMERYPSLTEALVLVRRGLLPRETIDRTLRQSGMSDPEFRRAYPDLINEIPPISDLIRFQVKEVFNPELSSQLRLFDERPVEASLWMEKLGYGGATGFQVTSDGAQIDARWSDLYWGAHWQHLSPGQVYEMYHRIRPSRVARYRAQGFDVKAFTLDDVRRNLRVADYPPAVRDYLAAVAYRPLRLIDIRARLRLDQGEQSRNWATEQLLDRGYHPDDAREVVNLWADLEKRKPGMFRQRLADKAPERLWRETERGYEIGTVSRQQANDVADRLQIARDAAGAILDTLDAKRKNSLVKASIGATKSAYMRGVLSRGEAVNQLTAMGIQPVRADEYADLWSVQRDDARRTLSVSEIMDSVRRGLLAPALAGTWLRNLGYNDIDSDLIVARAISQVGEAQARAVASAERSRRARAKELEATINQSEADRRRMQADLARLTPLASLKKWLRQGTIGVDYFTNRLSAMGFTPDAIALHLAEVQGEGNAEA